MQENIPECELLPEFSRGSQGRRGNFVPRGAFFALSVQAGNNVLLLERAEEVSGCESKVSSSMVKLPSRSCSRAQGR